jgi:allantoinase
MAMSYDLTVQGDLVLPDRVLVDGWLAVRDGCIAAIGDGEAPAAARSIDARGSWILPGGIDGQVHAGSQIGYPGIESLTHAAAAGGLTTVVDMPYDEPQPVTDGEILTDKIEAVARFAHVDVALYGSFAKTGGAERIAEQAEGGVCAYKIATYENHPVRFPRLSPPEMLKGFREVAKTGLPVAVHNEDMELVDDCVADLKAAGKTGAEFHSPSRPKLAETLANWQILEIAAAAGAHGHIVHTSIARACEQAAVFKAAGYKATVETCLHYLIFTDDDVARLGGRLKVNPPIRGADERDALWACVERGEIAFVSSDHGPWTLDRKDKADIFANMAGAPGVELLLPVFYTAAMERCADIHLVTAMLAEGPAKFFGLWPRKGALAVGSDADITVLARENWTVEETDLRGEIKWSPYHGMALSGRVTATVLRGDLIYDGAEVLSRAGMGRFVAPVGADSSGVTQVAAE